MADKSTLVFSGYVVAEGDDLGTTATTILKSSHHEFNEDGVYAFTFWKAVNDARAVSVMFRISDVEHWRRTVITTTSNDHVELKYVEDTGLQARRGSAATHADNNWTLIRIS